MSKPKLTRQIRSRIDEAVQHFVANQSLFESFAQALLAYFQNDPVLAPYIHFIKYRLKDPQNLRKKLIRKARQGDIIDKSNLFARITDLAGIQIIHLHTSQMKAMHQAILAVLEEQQLRLVRSPARIVGMWSMRRFSSPSGSPLADEDRCTPRFIMSFGQIKRPRSLAKCRSAH